MAGGWDGVGRPDGARSVCGGRARRQRAHRHVSCLAVAACWALHQARQQACLGPQPNCNATISSPPLCTGGNIQTLDAGPGSQCKSLSPAMRCLPAASLRCLPRACLSTRPPSTWLPQIYISAPTSSSICCRSAARLACSSARASAALRALRSASTICTTVAASCKPQTAGGKATPTDGLGKAAMALRAGQGLELLEAGAGTGRMPHFKQGSSTNS